MKNKKLHLILTIFSLIVFCTMFLLSAGCHLIIRDTASEAEWEERVEAERAAAEQAAIEEEQAEEEAPAEEPAKEVEEVAEEEKPLPNEPVTYTGSVEGVTVILIVNFKTTEVTGSLSLSGDDYIDATITDGKINISTFEIATNYSGVAGSEEFGEFPFNGIITGEITDDLSTFKGKMQPEHEATGTEFTATR